MPKPGSPLSRAFALLLLAGGFVLIYIGAVQPLVALFDERAAEIAQTRAMVSRFEASGRNQRAVSDTLAALRSDERYKRHHLPQPRLPLAVAALQGEMKRLVDRAGGKLISTQEVKARADEKHRRAISRVELEADPDALLTLLYGIEAHEPFLFIERLTIEPAYQTSVSRSRRRDDAPPAQLLRISFDVYGYMLGEGSS